MKVVCLFLNMVRPMISHRIQDVLIIEHMDRSISHSLNNPIQDNSIIKAYFIMQITEVGLFLCIIVGLLTENHSSVLVS